MGNLIRTRPPGDLELKGVQTFMHMHDSGVTIKASQLPSCLGADVYRVLRRLMYEEEHATGGDLWLVHDPAGKSFVHRGVEKTASPPQVLEHTSNRRRALSWR